MKNILVLLLLFLNSLTVVGQWQYWGGFELSKKTFFSIKSSLDCEYRHEVGKGFDQLNLKPTFERKIVKGISAGLSYRMAIKPTKNASNSLNLIGQQRLGIQVACSPLKWTNVSKRWSLGIDFKQQWNWRVTSRDLSIFRTKISGSYDVKNFPIGPYFSTEWFYCWNQDVIYGIDEITVVPGNRAWRTFVGAFVETNSRSNLKILAGLNQRIDKGSQQWILNLSYSISLP